MLSKKKGKFFKTVITLKENGLPVPPYNPNPKIVIQNEEKGKDKKIAA